MFAKFDYFDRLEQPTLVLCNPNDVELATIQNIDEFNLSVNFNAVSELSLTISKEPANPAYDLILLKRQILVKDVRTIGGEYSSEDLGYFIITDFNEIDGENGKAKTITATSCEIELNNLEVPYIPQSAEVGGETIEFAGTYYLYSTSEEHRSLLDVIMPAAPAWNFNVPIPALADLQRTFDENLDGTLYNFLMNKLAETYECIVEFDILNRIISFIPKQSALTQTSVFLSRSNFLNEVSLKESGSEYANCISVSGGDEEVGIGRVNPLGNGLMFDFSYDISQGLLSRGLVLGLTGIDIDNPLAPKVANNWETVFETQEPRYILAQRAYIVALEALTVASTAKDDAMIVLRSAEESKRIAYFGNSASLKATANINLATAQGNYNAAVVAYNAAVVTLNNKISDITDIQDLVQFDEFLDKDQLIELSRIVKMATYKDEFIILTDSMTNDEKLDEMVILYDKTKRLLQGGVLEGICEPRREITVNCEGFAFNQAFTHYGAQLQTGCLIDIEQPNEEITSYILQKIGINYSEKTMDLTFGNRYRISNPSSVFGDLYSNTSSMASIVASNYIEWGANIARVNELEIEREAAIQLNAQRVINSVNQRQEFSPNGSFFLSTNPLTGEPTEYGISIADGTMMFFTEYSKDEETGDIDYVGQMAVGRTVDGNGVNSFGFIGDTIVAGTITTDKLVAGSISKGTNLIINGSFENTATFPSSGTNWKSNFASSSIISSAGFDGYQFYRGFWNNNSSYAGVYLWNYGSSSLYDIPVVEYADYTFSYYYKASFSSSSTPYTNATIKFYNSGGTLLSTTNMVKTIVSGGGWERNSKRVKAPQYASIVRIEIIGGNFSGTGAYIDFDGIMLEQSAFLNDFSAYVGDFVSRYTVINDEGIKVLNGKIQILNDANDVVFNADDDGNLEITANITANSGNVGGYKITDSMIYSEGSSLGTKAGLHKLDVNGDFSIFAGGHSIGDGDAHVWTQIIVLSHDSTTVTFETGSWSGGWHAVDAFNGISGTIQSGIISDAGGYNGTKTLTVLSASTFKITDTYEPAISAGILRVYPNFYVNSDGYLYSNNADIKGNIIADTLTATTSGTLAGWTFDSTQMYKQTSTGGKYFYMQAPSSASDGTIALAFGGTKNGDNYTVNAPFYVTYGGALHAKGATISGDITATSGSFTGTVTANSGTIGGWNISSNGLEYGTGSSHMEINSNPSDSSYAMWFGADNPTDAPFYVSKAGALTAKSGNFGGWTVSSSGISNTYTTGGTTYTTNLKGGTLASGNYSIETDDIKATGGKIGGFTIDSTKLSYTSGNIYTSLQVGQLLTSNSSTGTVASMSPNNFYLSSPTGIIEIRIDVNGNLTAQKNGTVITIADFS